MIAQRIQSWPNLTSKPSVTIEGFPFLTQLAARDLRTVDINASNVQENKLDITSIKATATGVHLNSGFSSATVDHITGTAFISFASLESAAGVRGGTITADPSARPERGQRRCRPAQRHGAVRQTGPSQITVKIGGLADRVRAHRIASELHHPGPEAPAGLQVRGVAVVSQGIDVNASAQNTTLTQ